MLLSYDLWHKCDKFISFILLISCHSCRFYFYIKMRSHIYKKTQNFSNIPELERPRIGLPNGLSWCYSHTHEARLTRRSFWGGWGLIAESVLKTVIFPSDLVTSILYHVKNNSDNNGIETLRTHGGWLGCDNKLRVTHLLLPRQMLTSSSSPWTGSRT